MILNFNGVNWLRICLPSVMKSIQPGVTVYVIDNGSTDGSLRFVRMKFPRVRLIEFGSNLGFAEAYNRAIAKIKADYILLLNNDTLVLTRSWINRLVRHLESDPTIAAVGCKLVTMKDHTVLDSVGVMGIRHWRGFVDIGKYEKDRDQYDHPPMIPFSLCGAAMLVRRSAFELISGFDSKFYAYVEDIDLCWRLRLVGFKVVYEPTARVAHYYSATRGTTGLDPQKLYFCHRNLLRAIIKNCGSSTGWALRNYFLFTLLLTLGFAILEPRKATTLVKAVLWNLLNLKETLALRLKIQRTRVVEDGEILHVMFPKINRYQPEEHTQLRRLLDALFEHGQSLKVQPASSHSDS
jgi:hypothetical protein